MLIYFNPFKADILTPFTYSVFIILVTLILDFILIVSYLPTAMSHRIVEYVKPSLSNGMME